MTKPMLCMLRFHKWGPIQGDKAGAYRQCARCIATKRYRQNDLSWGDWRR
jgi:hypothetical protein